MKFLSSIVLILASAVTFAQGVSTDSVQPFTKLKIDGVAGVVGDYVILESDIERTQLEIKNQSQSTVDPSRCQVMGRLLDEKLLTHHAIQDSIIVPDGQINSFIDQQIERFQSQLGTIDKVVAFFKKESIAELRSELYEINKNVELARKMNAKITDEVEITPEEVRTFFKSIPKDELPTFGVELEIAQIVIRPEASEANRQDVVNRLKKYRADIVENGGSFATKAVLYTQDAASRKDGGLMMITKKSPLVKPFRDAVFSLQEGEVSEPFETEYGFHIATVEKIRGENYTVRHILLIPAVTKVEEEAAKDKIKLIKRRIEDDEITFGDAAREFSDETETKFNGGVLVNPITLDSKFELSKLDPTDYVKVSTLKDGDISTVFNDPTRTGNAQYKIMTVTNRYEEHIADYSKDYVKIKDLALRDKQVQAIRNWQKEKIEETYIRVNGENRDCEFASDWIKK